MDPPMIMNQSSFTTPNPSSYSLSELWPPPFPSNSDHLPGVLGLRMSTLATPADSTPTATALSVDESTVTDQSGSLLAGSKKKRKDTNSQDDSSKLVSTSTLTHFNESNAKRMKAAERATDENEDSKVEGETSSQTGNKNPSDQQNTKPPEPLKDYIHVRARRGQATDSHSLAERARREKISERMRILQDLVPGCNKVIGKALVLDEIINYIQSLQRQVEFLSMKLEAVNSRMNPAIEGFPSKDLAAPPFDANAMIFGQQAPREYAQVAQPEWLHMQVGGSFERAT